MSKESPTQPASPVTPTQEDRECVEKIREGHCSGWAITTEFAELLIAAHRAKAVEEATKEYEERLNDWFKAKEMLVAERDRLKGELSTALASEDTERKLASQYYQENAAICKERDSLKGEVERLKAVNEKLRHDWMEALPGD